MLKMIKQLMPKLHMLIMPTLQMTLMLKLFMLTIHMFVSHMLIMLLNIVEFINVLIVAGMAIWLNFAMII